MDSRVHIYKLLLLNNNEFFINQNLRNFWGLRTDRSIAMKLLDESLKEARNVEAQLSETAIALARQMGLPRRQRRKLVGLMNRFDRERSDLRNVMTRFEREQRVIAKEDRDQGREAVEISRHFKRLRHRLQLLNRISRAIDKAHHAKRHALYATLPEKHSIEAQQDRVLEAVMATLHLVINPQVQSETAQEIGCFHDIPLSTAAFLAHAHVAYRVALAQKRMGPLRFLDVGCGGGMKVLLASEVFSEADGLDYDQGYVAAATEVFHRAQAHRCSAFHANALTFDRYDRYDVIYFFQPMSDDAGLRALEDQVLAKARPGTIIIAPYQKFLLRVEELDCVRITDCVYVTGIDEQAGEWLHDEAQRMGPDILNPDRAVYVHTADWLRGLWLACAQNGYLPD